MKLIRIGEKGQEIACAIDQSGKARDVRAILPDFTPETISTLEENLAKADLEALPIVDTTGKRISTPMAQPKNIYCIVLNYTDHAIEAGMPIPEEPIPFNKTSETFCGANDALLYSKGMSKLDWEVELRIVIGREALDIRKEEAFDYVLGYTLVNDVSERAWRAERSGQWVKGKSFPNFCPSGPFIATKVELADVGNLGMWLDVNGERMQRGNTKTMIFDVPTIVSYVSQFTRLMPGDLICTGTPPGVGLGMKPPRYLKIGDVITLGIDGLGEQKQVVTAIGAQV